MSANIRYQGTNIANIFETPRLGLAAPNRNYQDAGVDIANTFTALSNVSIANGNIATRIPPTGILLSNGVDLSSTFAGNVSQYTVSTLSNPASATIRTISGTSVFTHSFSLTFANAAALTNYFNFGGRILISASNAGSFAANTADQRLQSAFSSIGTLVIFDLGHYRTGLGGTINNPTIGGSNLGTTSTPFYTLNIAAPYGTSSYTVSAVANAAVGSANVITITITLTLVRAGAVNDTYSGTRSSIIQQRRYSGVVPPTQAPPTFAQITFNW